MKKAECRDELFSDLFVRIQPAISIRQMTDKEPDFSINFNSLSWWISENVFEGWILLQQSKKLNKTCFFI
jgi:hypothetical protein